MTQLIAKIKHLSLSPEQFFMLSVLIVNAGNYGYNLILGRILGPAQFADAAVLITLLLVLSFAAMTFQLVTAKFSVLFSGTLFHTFIGKLYQQGLLFGLGVGLLMIVFAEQLHLLFQTTNARMFVIFGIGIPIYFVMSINRGVYQGRKAFQQLSMTYQGEMLSRLAITLALIIIFKVAPVTAIAVGLVISFLIGLIPFKRSLFRIVSTVRIASDHKKHIRNFFVLTAFYELTQIIINNSDILIVKHYFDAYEAGLYASLALIGRIVYFIAWMFVMILLPTVVALQKEGKATAPILFKYVGYIGAIALFIVSICFVFPNQMIVVLFGDAYTAMAPLLWKYALATGMFAVANIFAYYFLSLAQYIPVLISGVFGVLQLALVIFFHESLTQVVHMQLIAMLSLLIIQAISFFFLQRKQTLRPRKESIGL